MLAETEYYGGRHKSLQAKVFISAGSWTRPYDTDIKQLVNLLRQRHYQGLEITEYIFQSETHLSVIPYSLSRGMRVIYSQKSESTN
jgi:hypothetical protein